MKKISSDLTVESLSDEARSWNRRLQEARSEAISFLGLAKKPSGQVAASLRRKDFSETVITAVLSDLQADGYLDDLLLARRMLRQRQDRQAESRAALRQRMLAYGLAESAADMALAESADDLTTAQTLLDRKFGSNPAAPDSPNTVVRSLLQKMARFLSSRGYDADLIEQILERRFRH